MATEQLSPAMLAVLATIDNGSQPDGRSWRASGALVTRGLARWFGPLLQITDAGRAALEAAAEDHQAALADKAGG